MLWMKYWMETRLRFLVAVFVFTAIVLSGLLPFNAGRYAFTLFACLAACFSLSTFLATFMDDVWQIWGSLIALGVLRGFAALVSLPQTIDPFRVVGSGSPFVTHAIPWGAIIVCLVTTAGLFAGAIKIVQTRDY